MTNLDIHDIARSSCTYGLGGYYVSTPLEDQRRLLERLLAHWREGAGSRSNADRAEALGLVRSVRSVEAAVKDIAERTGDVPLLLGSSASGVGTINFAETRKALRERPVLVLFGTGQGLSPQVCAACDAMLPPVRRFSAYNHLSVRSAVAIVLDRILGDW